MLAEFDDFIYGNDTVDSVVMTYIEKSGVVINDHGDERGRISCERAREMFCGRPWVVGEVEETVKDSVDDRLGIDFYVPVDQRLTEIMCMEQGPKGIKVQIKSCLRKEKSFLSSHKGSIFNLATGENIFVLNGQDDFRVMMASLVGQMVVMADLTGTISEEFMLGFVAEELGDEEAVKAYLEYRDYLIEEEWFAKKLWSTTNQDRE